MLMAVGLWGACLLQEAAVAAEPVQLGELLTELRGTAAATEPVADAPGPGQVGYVTRRQVRAALKRAGIAPESLALPKRFRVSRKPHTLEADEVKALLWTPVSEVLAPCELLALTVQGRVTVGASPPQVEVTPPHNLRDGVMSLLVTVDSGDQRARVPVGLRLRCPPPVIKSGQWVQLETTTAHVRVTAPGKALQSGRVGEWVMVENTATGARLRGQVKSAQRIWVTR